MNLLEDEWLTVLRRNGEAHKITGLWQITAGIDLDNPIVDVVSPRADFKGALYQFFIGLIQKTFAPKNNQYQWKTYWDKPPNTEVLKNAFLSVKDAFEIDTHKPAFMQDFDLLADKNPVPIASLLIDTSGGGTFFIKEGGSSYISPYWAAIALFTLQTNAPAGGVGHRTGLRGGGPLTTLILPNETEQTASLWHKLWLNVLAKQDSDLQEAHHIFPWLAKTRTSEANSKTNITTPEQGHPYQMYWGMPRRIRLDFDNTTAGYCDISHEYSEQLISQYRTQNYGVNYSSTWIHPLTPYGRDPEKESNPVKPKVGGFNYHHWLGVVLDDDINHKQSAKVVQVYSERREIIGADYQPHLWLFGYDMDKMKARCWYETTMPIFPIPQEKKKILQNHVSKMIGTASEVALDVRSTLKQAWFEKPKEAKGEISFTDTQFWQITETDFYRLVEQLIKCCDSDEQVNELFAEWKQILRRQALTLFDHWALSSNNEDGDMKRVVTARCQLEKWLNVGKNMKALVA